MSEKVFGLTTLNVQGMFQSPFLQAGRIFLAMLVVWGLVAEIIGQTPIGKTLPSSVGADSFEFDLKVRYLEQSIRERGRLDCIIVGDSIANDGLNPDLIEQTYARQTSKPLHCFNFGMPAITIEASAPLAQALVNRYHPRLLIFMLSPRDFAPKFGAPYHHIAEADWTQYNLGNSTLRGWAVNSLYGYRYFLFAKYWLNPANRDRFAEINRSILANGFTPLYGTRAEKRTSYPQPDYSLSNPEAMRGFQILLRLKQSGHQILIVDAPVDPSYYPSYLQSPEKYVTEYLDPMQAAFQPLQIHFLITRELSLKVPEDAWYDPLHMNQKGVPVFSQWLAEQLIALDLIK